MTNPPAALPFPRGSRVVILAPHPDDETLGCGALIASARRRGLFVAVIALTDGQASHPGSRRWPPATLARVRRAELRRAMARLGQPQSRVRFMGGQDGHLCGQDPALALRRIFYRWRATTVLVTSPLDHHVDHQAAYSLAVRATYSTEIKLATYRVWSKPLGGARCLSRETSAKRWAMAAHRSQIGPYIADATDGFTFEPALLRTMLAGPERFELVPVSARRPIQRGNLASLRPVRLKCSSC